MSTARRFSYSLLISTVVFSLFAVVAFSGVFPWIEAQFYSPKVVDGLQSRMDKVEANFEAWQTATVGRLDKLLSEGSFSGVFSPVSSRDSLQNRFQAAKLFLLGDKGPGSLRILSLDRTQIHFSTEDADVKVRGDFGLTYRPVSELGGLPDLVTTGTTRLIADPKGMGLYFLHPWTDPVAKTSGFALLFLSWDDWRFGLGTVDQVLAAQTPVALADGQILVSLLGRSADAALVSRVKDLARQGVLPPVQRLATSGGLGVALVHRGGTNLVVPTSLLELDAVLKGLLLVSLFTVVFLVTFLVANLRGEPLSVVTRKVKRFQLQVVKQYLDLKEQDRIQSLRDELASHSGEIRADVRKSLGRVRRRDQEWVDRYIDTSWQEVMDLLRGPAPPAETTSNADWKRLETLLQQALTQGRFVVSAPPSAAAPAVPTDVEDVEELEDVSDLEVVDEAEAVEELDLVEDAEEVENAEDVEEAEEVEEIGELDADDEVAEVEELEPVEPEVVDGVGEGDPDEGIDGDSGEDLEELEESDDAVVPVEEIRAPAPAFSVLRSTRSEPVSELEGDDGDLEPLDDLEELPVERVEGPGTNTSYPLERLDAAWRTSSADVFHVDDGVVSLNDDVFSDALPSEDAFGQLVDEVLSGTPDSEFVPLEHEDLVPQHRAREWRWTSGGFDWDRFAQGHDEVNLFRALSDLVSELDGFTAAILVANDGWIVQSSVGFSDAGKELLRFTEDSRINREFLSVRALHVLEGGTANPVLAASFHAKDLKFLKAVVCAPLLYRHQPAWLMLGLRREPGDVVALLAPRQVG